ncbi:occludin [Microcaecilia unicolor]|uniref:Occludin n=1 Tax=Microcaecilia unicolor TaxID=1415580 RepID=A0A6P7X0W3_9AMPH|nr:occludin [Microcaecilia unicolor]
MSARPMESPPPYRPDDFKPSFYAPSKDMYGGEVRSQPAYSYYPEDEVHHFYKWTSPPGIIKIMSVLIIVMSIGIFACVASTLAWDLDFSGSGLGYPMYGTSGGNYGSFGSGYGSYGGGANFGYGFGYGGNYTDPRAAKGFILAMAAFCFLCGMVIFIITVTRNQMSRSRRFYLIVIVVSAILGIMTLIATIVYIMGVNPVAQASGSVFYTQIVSICNQFYAPATTGVFVNQYLYHYCVVEPQEAIAIVLGFLIVLAFALIIFFAVKTRSKINDCGKRNILWDKLVFEGEGDPKVEEWVKNVSMDPEQPPPLSEYTDKVNGSVADYSRTNGVGAYPDASYRHSPVPEVVYPLKNEARKPSNVYSSSSDATSKKPQQKKRAGRPRRTETEVFDTDYTTGGESCEELDEENWEREFPPITSDQQRQEYKHEFDVGLQEYKKLQSDLEAISNMLDRVDRELDNLPEGSEAYKIAADEYNRLKEIKSSADYQNKKRRSKQLKQKLAHIKRMVGDYDSQRL